MGVDAFLDRVFAKVSAPAAVRGYEIHHWPYAKNPTDEALGILPVPGVDPEALIRRVMDVDHYLGNIQHLVESRSIKDARFAAPKQVRFYQKIKLPILGFIHNEMVLTDGGERDGYRIAYWELLEPETDRLNPKEGARSEYNVGCWIAAPGVVGYALSSAPRRDDVGRLKFAALTKGADLAAGQVLKENIEGMSAWAKKG